MRLLIVAMMAMVVMTTGCKTLGGGCRHQKHLKCVPCRAKYEAQESAKKAVKCKTCGIVKGACKCPAVKKCEKCGDAPCKCKK